MNDFMKDYRDLDINSQWEIVKLFFNLESSFRFIAVTLVKKLEKS
jgi:hypothetical protein